MRDSGGAVARRRPHSHLKQHLFHRVSLIHSYSSCLLRTYCVLDIIQDLGDVAVDKTDVAPVFMALEPKGQVVTIK